MSSVLRIGMIPFTNLFPIYHELKTRFDCSDYMFIEGVPSSLNQMLRNGKIDLAPTSSVEYLRDKDAYSFLNGHSISSLGPVRSIILFSHVPIESLDGQVVYVTHQSETSVLMLDVILRRFYGVKVTRQVTRTPVKEAIYEHSAYLSIGDEALETYVTARKVKNEGDYFDVCVMEGHSFYIYDLGFLWHKLTGHPFVYALWTYRKDLSPEKLELIRKLSDDITKAREAAFAELPAIANLAPIAESIGTEEVVSYWNEVSYDLGKEHLKGLKLFESYCREFNLLIQDPL